MGKLIKAVAAKVEVEVMTPKGTALYESTFWDYLISAVNGKAPTGDLEAICAAKEVRKLLLEAKVAKAETLTLEDAQFKLLHGAVKVYTPALPPTVAMELDGFLFALEDKSEKNPGGVEKVELATKK